MVSLDGGGLQAKSMTSYRAVQDGGYALPWQRYDNNKMAAIHNLKKNNNNTLSIHIQQQKYSLSVL